jgi:hydroxymethylbilane synthase
MSDTTPLRIGTRASPLAKWQAHWVAEQLAALGVATKLVLISTRGDQQQSGPIGQIGAEGVFTKAIQQALLDEEIDLAVHSLKDLPTEPVDGLSLAAVPQRGPCGDVVVCREAASLAALPAGSVIGTGSLRRQAQLLSHRADLVMTDIRGNVDTRLSKLDDGAYDALVMAEAGLVRLDMADRITEVIPRDVMLPAVGQGALGIEARDGDTATRDALSPLNDPVTFAAVAAERAMLAALRGGCLAPVGGWARQEGNQLKLSAVVLAADGGQRCDVEATDHLDNAVELGQRVAAQLLAQGAGDLIAASRIERGQRIERGHG